MRARAYRGTIAAMTSDPVRAVAYIRVSKERDEMTSPELQETAIRDHCTRHGYELVEVISDLDLTGRFWKRRQVERAVAMVESGDISAIVVWKWSRVARNRLDWNIALDRVESLGGRLESATEAIDVRTSSGRLARGMLAEIAAFESERAGEQWQETHRRRWAKGLTHSGVPRLGYTYTREHGYQPDPETAPIVRELYERYLAGEGGTRLADWLHKSGVEMTSRGIRYYMKTGFAAGYISHHDPSCQAAHRPGTRCPNVITSVGAHPGIIDDDTHQRYLAMHGERATLPPRLVSPVSTVSGLLFCTSCGYRMARHGGKYPYFRCTGEPCPAPTTVRETRAIEAVREWLPSINDELARLAKDEGGQATARASRQRYERKALDAEKALQNLALDRARRIILEPVYLAARAELEAEMNEALAAARKIELSADISDTQRALAKDLAASWADMSPAARNRVLRKLDCKVDVTPVGGIGKRPKVRVYGNWDNLPS